MPSLKDFRNRIASVKSTRKRDNADKIIHTFEGLGRKRLSFADALLVSQYVLEMAERRDFDVCTVLYNRFRSVIKQDPTAQQLIPFAIENKPAEVKADEG